MAQMNTETYTSCPPLPSLPSVLSATPSLTRVDGVTSTFRRAQRRVLTANRRWLDPEKSIGRHIGKTRWDHIWEAIGPARDVFNKIAPDIKSYLENTVEPTSSRAIWSMYMVGKSPILSAPSIIFCCEVLEHRRYMRTSIKESGILDSHPGVKTGHMPRPPGFDELVPLANEDVLQGDSDSLFVLCSQSKSACGSQLLLTTDGEEPRTCYAIATIGGVVQLGKDYYYTTAAHALNSGTELCETSYPEDYVVDDDALSWDGSDSTDSATIYSHEEAPVGSFTPGNNPWNMSGNKLQHSEERFGGFQDGTLYHVEIKAAQLEGSPSSAYPFPEQTGLLLGPIGRSLMSTSVDSDDRAAGLDYALIQVSSGDHILENVIRIGIDDQSTVRVQSVVRSEPQDSEVLAATSRGAIRGHISGTPSYSSAPGHCIFKKMFRVSLEEPLQRGDCGTWIIDTKCGDLYGHIVAGSPDDGLALIAPFTDIFEDLQHTLGSPPRLPTRRKEIIGMKSYYTGIPRSEGSSHHSVPDDATLETTSSTKTSPIIYAVPPSPNYNPLARLHPATYPTLQLHEDFMRNLRTGRAELDPASYFVREPFRDLLGKASHTPINWENPEKLDKAFQGINIHAIYHEAQREHIALIAEASITNDGRQPEWGYQDCVIQSLMRYFGHLFFSRANNPACMACESLTISKGYTAPSPEETSGGALIVERFECLECRAESRLPRNPNDRDLMQTFRNDESRWTKSFGMLCRAVGSRVRWVWNDRNHVWLEIYSQRQERWVHVDVRNMAWDQPLLYTKVWRRKISYCIAFSADGATDVTARYIRSSEYALPRTECTEEDLRHFLQDIQTLRRRGMSEEDKVRLENEDAKEARELQSYVGESLASELSRCFTTGGLPSGKSTTIDLFVSVRNRGVSMGIPAPSQ